MTTARTNPASAVARQHIDVIVRTLALKEREAALLHALDSIQMLADVDARPIVVVNGQRYHPPLLDALRQRADMLVHYVPTASIGLALTAGRRLVTAPSFMFLDDDDELLAPGFGAVARYMSEHADWDAIVTNGYFSAQGQRRPLYLDLRAHAEDPLRGLVEESWLFPGASIFRTASVSAEFLDVGRDHQEWTCIAFLLVMAGMRIRFLDVPTVTYNDTEISASKGVAHQEAALELLGEMKANPRVDRQTRAALERKYRNTLHILASAYWRQGARGKSWRCHMRSMRPPYTFKYLLFSRKLLTRAPK